MAPVIGKGADMTADKHIWTVFLASMEKSLPEECPITLEHAKLHLDSAIDSAEHGDQEQVAPPG